MGKFSFPYHSAEAPVAGRKQQPGSTRSRL
jgi:hypothetical protein